MRKANLFSILFCAGAIGACPVSGVLAASPQATEFSIPSQTLSSAVTQFAHQSGLHVAIDGAIAGKLHSNPVKGVMTPDEALQKMLIGTGISPNRQPDGLIFLTRPSIHASALTTRPAGATHGSEAEAIVVLGAGNARETQSISRTIIREATPGTSPFKVLSMLPGVVFTSSDSLGINEASQQVIIRSFDQSRLGFTMDGVPLGNLNYGNDNGLSIARALQGENNGRATLAQGAGSVAVAASNDLGGALEFTSVDPTDRMGVDVEGTVGSASTWRTFMRVNSGLLPGGGKFYVSYDYGDANKWKGDGQQRQQQANAKFVQPLGEKVKLTLFGDWALRQENDYRDLSLATIQKYGYDVDDINGNYNLAKQIALASQQGTPYPAGIGTTNGGSAQDFVYYNNATLRQDILGYGRLDFNLTDRLQGSATVYGHTNSGQGVWATPTTPTPAELGGSPISIRTTEYGIHREGFIGNLSYRLANHTIEGGFWFENDDFEEARRFYPLGLDGTPGGLHWYKDNWFNTQWQATFNSRTYQVHLQDTWQITHALKLNYGFKSLIVDDTARQIGANNGGVKTSADGYPSGSIQAANGFLPQVGANYRINTHHEVFADFARNMAAFDNSQTGKTSPFATTVAGYDAIKDTIKPEMSYTEEVGYRYHDRAIQASVTGYYVEFQNRLLSIREGATVLGNPLILSNVGGVTARGVDVAFNYAFAPNWSLYASYAFNDSRYDDNVSSGGVTYQIKGKDVVAMPRNLANLKLGYDDGSIWGNINMQFQDRRTYTYTNDSWVPANEIFNLSLGYRVHSRNIFLSGLDAQINVTNLFDKKYASTVGSQGFQFTDPQHTFATLLAGAPRMVFFTLRKHF